MPHRDDSRRRLGSALRWVVALPILLGSMRCEGGAPADRGATDSGAQTPPAAPAAVSRAADAELLLEGDGPLVSVYLDDYGVDATVSALAEAAALLRRDCHMQAHHLGRMAYERLGGAAVASSRHECHAGAVHGAIEAMLQDRGIDVLGEDVGEICGGDSGPFDAHQCMHGVGHGLLAWADYELPDALELCDRLGRPASRESCYTGVFMENVVGGLAGPGGRATEFLSADPHYPCNAVAGRYVNLCYFYQTSRMVQLFDADFARVSAACAEAPGAATSYCFRSMGRDVGAQTRGDPPEAIRLCGMIEDVYDRRLCLEGAVQDYFWQPSGADDALAFCRTLVDEGEKASCYGTIMGRAREVLPSSEERGSFCRAVEEPWRAGCLSG